ncbi:flagellar export protein FliJ [Paenibacillus stellifer]|uniref:Flagellar FliJ protein n=1 Tax=Paenibacillus stellifer TaxID=169760 RepID=A0A089LSF4_9BACL|nr:flagellar export protein FliJ [Paenibacillus stellifer]AIQ64451.1 flagellar export protein FliJ [Paenibacillus stellifer]
MKFNYNFQKVVDLKGNERTQAEWMLSSALGELEAQEKSLAELMEQRNEMLFQLQAAAEQCSSMNKIRELQDYVDFLENRIVHKHQQINAAHQKVVRKQDELNEKALDEKVWLKAREKALSLFQHNMNLREQNDLDEMATVRFAMKSL